MNSVRSQGKGKLTGARGIKFNGLFRHNRGLHGWDTLIRLKTQELANYVLGKRNELSLTEPRPALERDDSQEARNLILSLTSAEARKLGMRKNTLWYIQRSRMARDTKLGYERIIVVVPNQHVLKRYAEACQRHGLEPTSMAKLVSCFHAKT